MNRSARGRWFVFPAALLCVWCRCSGADMPEAAPRIQCDEPVFHFGVKQQSSALLKHSFRIVNTGNTPLVITNVQRTIPCGCQGGATIADSVVSPGSNTLVSITLPMNRDKGPLNESWFVESNDPRAPRYEITLSGRIAVDVEVRPAGVNFGEIQPDFAGERLVEVMCETNVSFEITNAISTTPHFAVTVERLTSLRHQLKIRTVPPFERGLMTGTIQLFTDNPEYGEIEVPVAATVPVRVTVVPAEIWLERLHPAVWNLALASREKKPFKILSLRSPDPNIKASCTALSSDGYRVSVESPAAAVDWEGKQFVIETDHPEAERIVLPIHVR